MHALVALSVEFFLDQKYVSIRRRGKARKFQAEVIAVGHECDLAILTVKDDEFWTGITPLELADIPVLCTCFYE